MKRRFLVVLTFGLFVPCVHFGCAVEPNAGQTKAIAQIKKLGGRITIDEKSPGKPVIGVDFYGQENTNAGLEHLEGLAQLQNLNLYSTGVTDAGLKHLEGLTQLTKLDLMDTSVTDAGLEHLKGLMQLRRLNLWGSQVTDAGLEHLKGLTQLRELCLSDTSVTDQGVKKLEQALPDCRIER